MATQRNQCLPLLCPSVCGICYISHYFEGIFNIGLSYASPLRSDNQYLSSLYCKLGGFHDRDISATY